MATIKRLTTRRAGAVGLWLSAPGKNADTASADDLLISPTDPNFSFFENGMVTLTSNLSAVVVVHFDSELSDVPVVIHQFCHHSEAFLPPWQSGELDVIQKQGELPRYFIKVFTDRLEFNQLRKSQYQIRYLVAMNNL